MNTLMKSVHITTQKKDAQMRQVLIGLTSLLSQQGGRSLLPLRRLYHKLIQQLLLIRHLDIS